MISYNFEIDKEACFADFAQSLIRLNAYSFARNQFNHYFSIEKPLTNEEKKVLEKFKERLQKRNDGFIWLWDKYVKKEEGAGFFWLWNRYSGVKIENQKDALLWQNIHQVLDERFERIWIEELPKLTVWQQKLQQYSFTYLNNIIFYKIAIFFGVNINSWNKITTKLFFCYDKNFPFGSAKREFKNLFILNISNVSLEHINKVINVLAHETAHLIEYTSPLSEELLKNSYLRIIKPAGLKRKGPPWRHLFVEAVITSIAGSGHSYNYVKHKLFYDPNAPQENKSTVFDYNKMPNNYAYQIRAAVAQIIDLTIEYLDKEKKIDQEYSDAIARAWQDLRQKMV